LTERWHSLNGFDPEGSFKDAGFEAKVEDHLRNDFYPALRKLVHAGLFVVKYGLNTDWFERVANLLIEVFGVCGKLAALPPPGARTPTGRTTRGTVGLEVLLGARALATYATRMNRYEYLPGLLKKYVNPIGSSTARKREPFLFWPLRMNVEGNDRIAYAWQAVVEPSWLDFFGSRRSFLDSASQLEFILFLNSYLATQIPDATQWISEFRPDSSFQYWYGSDLWRYRLDSVAPMAEKIYESLIMGPDAPILLELSVEHSVFQKAFSPSSSTTPGHRQELFVEFLRQLLKWQAQAALSQGCFLHHEPDWGPVLGPRMRDDPRLP
jgi:hypothetical protein